MLTHKLQIEYKPTQLFLPVNVEHMIDESDPVVSFREVIGGLNLSRYIKTSRKGRHDYHPEAMLQLILFGFMENIRSLRQLEKACQVDIRFMYLGKGITPSFMAFQRFIDEKLTESIDDIFYAINQFFIAKQEVDIRVLHVDGTKIEANAHKFSFVWKKAVLNHQAKLYLKISKLLKEAAIEFDVDVEIREAYEPQHLEPLRMMLEQAVEKDGIAFVYGKGNHKPRIQRAFERVTEFQDKLKEYQNHLLICGDRNSYSKSDHDATFMHGKEDYYSKTGIFKPYYNVQIGVSNEYILHYGIYSNPTDTKTWIPFFDEFYKRYRMYPKTPVADAGYGSYDNYMYNLSCGMELSMKYNTFSKEEEKSFQKNLYNIKNMRLEEDRLISEDGQVYRYSHEYQKNTGVYPNIKQVYVHQAWEESFKEKGIPQKISRDIVLLQMQDHAKQLLKSEEGIQLRIRRSIEVEGAFGDIKANCEYTRIQRRGFKGVSTEICLVLIGYNVRKYHAKKHRILN
jgi:transposase